MWVDKHGRHTAAILTQETEMALFYTLYLVVKKLGARLDR